MVKKVEMYFHFKPFAENFLHKNLLTKVKEESKINFTFLLVN